MRVIYYSGISAGQKLSMIILSGWAFQGMSVVATEAVMHESFEKQYCNTATPSSAVLLLDKFLKRRFAQRRVWELFKKNHDRNIYGK